MSCPQRLSFRSPELLIPSHIKPWRAANDQERLDIENGLLLSANVDRLFDNGLISFGDGGDMLAKVDDQTIRQLNLPEKIGGSLSSRNRYYLGYHQEFYGFN